VTGRWLETAAAIGAEITAAAVWDGPRCGWIGADLDEDPVTGELLEYHRALGPSLYDGTAGIALFLAELHAVAGEEEARRAALGAARAALDATRRADPGPALYTGSLGVALAVARAGRLAGAPELADEAVALARGAVATDGEHDLLAGAAGTIVAALAFGDAELAAALRALGDRLLAAARESDGTLSWPSPSAPGEPGLTGFSHGAAGIGYALLELWAACGHERFRAAADGAFGYERGCFDARAGNWPDFRASRGRPRGSRRFATFWCHGAPGIALSRLRAHELTGDPRMRDEAELALATTGAAVERDLAGGRAGFSLCHGLAGNAEVALAAGDGRGRELAEEVAEFGVRAHAAEGRWRCGIGTGQTPSLMLGLAGIGRFYLRLAEPELPSALAPHELRAGV
jgi:lantibiotic modifying enzyme